MKININLFLNMRCHHPCVRCLTHCDLELNKTLRICIISEKEVNLARYTQIFERFFPGNFVPFDFHPWNFQLNGSLFGNLTISGFSGTFTWKFFVPFVPVSKISEFLVEW